MTFIVILKSGDNFTIISKDMKTIKISGYGKSHQYSMSKQQYE
jgi:hypothetical protein